MIIIPNKNPKKLKTSIDLGITLFPSVIFIILPCQKSSKALLSIKFSLSIKIPFVKNIKPFLLCPLQNFFLSITCYQRSKYYRQLNPPLKSPFIECSIRFQSPQKVKIGKQYFINKKLINVKRNKAFTARTR